MFYLKVVPVISGHLVNNWRSLRHCSVYKQTSHNLHLPVFVLLNICWRLHGLFQSCSKVEYQRDNLHLLFKKPKGRLPNEKQQGENKEVIWGETALLSLNSPAAVFTKVDWILLPSSSARNLADTFCGISLP